MQVSAALVDLARVSAKKDIRRVEIELNAFVRSFKLPATLRMVVRWRM